MGRFPVAADEPDSPMSRLGTDLRPRNTRDNSEADEKRHTWKSLAAHDALRELSKFHTGHFEVNRVMGSWEIISK